MTLNELNVSEAAEHCGIKETTFRRLCKEGRGPKARREGRTLRFLEEHLDEFLTEYKDQAYSTTAAKATGNGKSKGRKAAANPLD